MGTRPKSRVALVGPHSPLAQSGRGTITVCSSSQQIWKIHKLRFVYKSKGHLIIKNTHLELAHGFEFHWLSGQVLLWRHHIRKDVQEEGTRAGSVHSERHNITNDGLELINYLLIPMDSTTINYSTHLHHESLQGDRVKGVLLAVVEL